VLEKGWRMGEAREGMKENGKTGSSSYLFTFHQIIQQRYYNQ